MNVVQTNQSSADTVDVIVQLSTDVAVHATDETPRNISASGDSVTQWLVSWLAAQEVRVRRFARALQFPSEA